MEVLVVLNSLVNLVLIGYALARVLPRFYFHISRTMFQRKPYGIALYWRGKPYMFWDAEGVSYTGINSTHIAHIQWANPDRLVDKPYGKHDKSPWHSFKESHGW